MIYRCPNCHGALEYNPISDEMECAHCGDGFSMQEMALGNQKIYDYALENGKLTTVDEESVDRANYIPVGDNTIWDFYGIKEKMECRIYTCTSCGAELAVSDTEVSTWCAYCGQPTVVYSRVSKELKPDYVIPFKTTREQAIKDIRKSIRRTVFAPRAVKRFEVEKVRGIYIPYFLFDVHFRNNQKLTSLDKNNSYQRWQIRGECKFKGISCDASSYLNDELTQHLEPFDYNEMKDFNAAYLSGFYAERNDLSVGEMKKTVSNRCNVMYTSKINKEFNLRPEDTEIKSEYPKCAIKKADYVLFPVWFLTFRYKNTPYTILMNGQTGKIVGATPFHIGKIILFYLIVNILTILAFVLGYSYFPDLIYGSLFLILLFVVFIMAPYSVGITYFIKYKKMVSLSKLKSTEKFVRNRQESDEWKY